MYASAIQLDKIKYRFTSLLGKASGFGTNIGTSIRFDNNRKSSEFKSQVEH